MFEQKPPRRPVKIAHSVYCVFDPAGYTLESRRGEAKWISIPTWEKLPCELFFVFFFAFFLEQRLSGALVLFHPLINCCAETGQSEAETLKGSLDERGEKQRGKGCSGPFLLALVRSQTMRSKLRSVPLTCQKHQGFKEAKAQKYFYGEKLTQQNLFVCLFFSIIMHFKVCPPERNGTTFTLPEIFAIRTSTTSLRI